MSEKYDSRPNEAQASGAMPSDPASRVFPVKSPAGPSWRRLMLPRWFAPVVTAITFGIVAEAFLVPVVIFNQDWVDGARAMAFTAISVAAAWLVVAIIRVVRGLWKQISFASNLILVIVLAIVGAGGLVARVPIRSLQASKYESVGDWSDAVDQFIRAVADPSCGQGCNRTMMYEEARAYYNLGLQREEQHDYKGAIVAFERILSAASVQPFIQDAWAELAHTYFEYGLQLLNQHSYQAAINQFDAVEAALPNSPYAHPAHLAAATAYFAFAQEEIPGGSCLYAVANLETIVSDYADSPEALLAKAELATPVTVNGVIQGFPHATIEQAWLSKSAYAPPQTQSAPYGSYWFSGEYKTSINPSTGEYAFNDVRPGRYTVSTFRQTGSNWDYTWWYANNDVSLYFLDVPPLCPFTWDVLQY